MFPEPPRPALHLSDHFRLVQGGDVSYRAYTGKTRVQCDECVWLLHEAHGVGEPPRASRVVRLVAKNGTKTMMLLCHVHTNMWHKIDGK